MPFVGIWFALLTATLDNNAWGWTLLRYAETTVDRGNGEESFDPSQLWPHP